MVDRVASLFIPNGVKDAVVWIYRYMASGEHDPAGHRPFEALSIQHLVSLHRHCTVLGYGTLADKTTKRLQYLLRTTVSTVRELELVVLAMPTLFDELALQAAHKLLQPSTVDLTPYTELALINPGFKDVLHTTVDKILIQRIEASRRYYERGNRLAKPAAQVGQKMEHRQSSVKVTPSPAEKKQVKFAEAKERNKG